MVEANNSITMIDESLNNLAAKLTVRTDDRDPHAAPAIA